MDVKVQNDPGRLFGLIHEIITAQPDWQSSLAPRIVLGLWHPRFIAFAKERLPYCRRSYIGRNPYIARKYFWNDCDAFSIRFSALTTADGEKYVSELGSLLILTSCAIPTGIGSELSARVLGRV